MNQNARNNKMLNAIRGRTGLLILLALLLVTAFPVVAQNIVEAPLENPTHRFQEIADGVYFVTGSGSIFVQSNSMMIEGKDEVLLVDSHVTPAAARALAAAVKDFTGKPVRYLVNSHYHFDHAHGNQVFPDDVEIIGHEYTREKLLGNVLEQRTFLSFTEGIPDQNRLLKLEIEAETNASRKEALEARLRIQEAHVKALPETVPTPPNITLQNKMTIFQDDREIQMLFLGRGHTGGDVVTYLPKERVVFTGDLMLPFLSYMGDGFADEWPDTLERLKNLDVDVILPGHGGPIRDKQVVTNFQNLLRDLWKRVEALKKQGLSAEEAAQRVDLTAHKKGFPQIRAPGYDVRAVERIYQRLDEK